MDDVITVQLDLEDKTLSFAKNNAPLVLAFENLPSVELQPVVVFHTSSHGGKVQIYDLVRLPKEQVLLSGNVLYLLIYHITMLQKYFKMRS